MVRPEVVPLLNGVMLKHYEISTNRYGTSCEAEVLRNIGVGLSPRFVIERLRRRRLKISPTEVRNANCLTAFLLRFASRNKERLGGIAAQP